MMEGLPRHNHPAEPLRNMVGDEHEKSRTSPVTYSSNPVEVVARVYPQSFGCNLPTIIPAFPHIRKSTVGHRAIRWVIAKWNFQ